jgi:FkbM family methyltransferase
MQAAIKRWVRPVALPLLHCWQWVHDYTLGKLREHRVSRDRRKILRDGTVILKDVHGMRFILYPFDRPNLFSLFRRSSDVREFEAIPRLVQAGDIAFDVGAHAGIYSVLLSRLCGPNGRVWAFEPVPDTYWRLRETLALNRCDNVIPVRAAVFEKNGVAKMNLFEPEHSEWNTFGEPSFFTPEGIPIPPRQSMVVPARSLDDFCEAAQIKRVNFMKVDVEGFECSVFRGAERLLKEHRVDYICFEISKGPLKSAGIESRGVFDALKAHGYAAYRFDRQTARFQGPVQDTSESWTNFFASWKDLSNLEPADHVPDQRREEASASLSLQ